MPNMIWLYFQCVYPSRSTRNSSVRLHVTPGWFLCSNERTPGIRTRIPHMKQPHYIPISSCLILYGLNGSSTWSGHPFRMKSTTSAKTGSQLIVFWIVLQVTGRAWIWATLKMLVHSDCVSLSGRGKQDSPSALQWAWVDSYFRSSTHLWSRAAASEGTPFFGPRMAVSGLWSVIKVKHLPYKYWWNFLTLSMSEIASFSSCA